jgi:membrane carboxypeptidase/penicillin-binding protein
MNITNQEADNGIFALLFTKKSDSIDGGTGGRIRYKYHLEGEIGGKTGTTNKNSDAWFMGFTPQLVSGVWVGGEDRDSS